jgi:probable HAF family extracellular repeat protein
LGQVVGRADWADVGPDRLHAFLYTGGRMIDLSDLVEPASGWSQLFPIAINDSGQITGQGTAPDGHTRAMLLTPVVKQEAAR